MLRLFSLSNNASVILPSRSIKKDGRIIVADLKENEQLITESCVDLKGDLMSPRKNGHSTKRHFALQNIQGLSTQV